MLEHVEDKCGVLREIVESIAILASIGGVDVYVKERLLFIQSKLMDQLDTVKQICGEDVYALINSILYSKMRDETALNKFMLSIHECMVKNGCVSNVSIVE